MTTARVNWGGIDTMVTEVSEDVVAKAEVHHTFVRQLKPAEFFDMGLRP